jgi:hypothetical protein
MPDEPVHHRVIEYTAYEESDSLRAVIELTDTWPWFPDGGRTAHRMSLSVVVDIQSRRITHANADFHDFPHAECPLIAPVFTDMAGMSLAEGFNKELSRRFGGPSGCSHVVTLARMLAPSAMLSLSSVNLRRSREQRRQDASEHRVPERHRPSPWLRNSCHLWAADGIGEQKLALGWRPGTGAYPNPSLDSLLRGEAEETE